MSADLLEVAFTLALEAGRAALRFYDGPVSVEHKSDGSPLTLADKAAHEAIASGLARATPGIPLLSEESPPESIASRRSWERFWLVDPLDGTKEFLKRSGEFTVNVALVERGAPVLGVVHVPVLGVTYTGANRAAHVHSRGAKRPIRSRALPASEVVVLASRDHAGPELDAMLARVANVRRESAGSALKFGLLAEGRADLYARTRPTMEWDTAAGQAVLEAAGGKLTDLAGKALAYNKESLVNPSFVAWGDATFDWPRRLSGS
ncbi:MAG TPA: 3'(2'),5'-bisphosphate nucleotidase CysQ [Planctomycetota bacterium]|nr:3'(2'),5'-bisphosphate nucleotidase CysQ [Planctomycetota bacterium]